MTIEDIALQMTPGIGVKGAVHLLGIFGDARGIFAAAPEELAMKAALREDIIRNIVHRKGFAAAEKELGYCRRNSISAIASTDPEFPALLREIPDYEAIDTVMAGGSYFSPQLLSSLAGRLRTREDAPDEELSAREREILVAVCRGLSNQEIADELFISKRTVDKHRANILEKTGCKNTASLVVYAIRKGIVEI